MWWRSGLRTSGRLRDCWTVNGVNASADYGRDRSADDGSDSGADDLSVSSAEQRSVAGALKSSQLGGDSIEYFPGSDVFKSWRITRARVNFVFNDCQFGYSDY
jgi:hypothetical protein